MNKLFARRFEDLDSEMEKVALTLKSSSSEMMGSSENVNSEQFLEWRVKVKNLTVKVCGKESEHYKEFEKAESSTSFSGNYSKYKNTCAVFKALKEDYFGGYLTSLKSLVQAEVFGSELEQANELLKGGYFSPAAVIAGTVLETALRELCDREGISHGKLDKMNSDLAKAGVYNSIVQKQITAYAGVRNSAAHGKPNEFSKADVE